jgi:hypothetical protein
LALEAGIPAGFGKNSRLGVRRATGTSAIAGAFCKKIASISHDIINAIYVLSVSGDGSKRSYCNYHCSCPIQGNPGLLWEPGWGTKCTVINAVHSRSRNDL